MAPVMRAVSAGQSITDGARNRPFCLSPILTLGVGTAGASITPLDELPITASASRSALQ